MYNHRHRYRGPRRPPGHPGPGHPGHPAGHPGTGSMPSVPCADDPPPHTSSNASGGDQQVHGATDAAEPRHAAADKGSAPRGAESIAGLPDGGGSKRPAACCWAMSPELASWLLAAGFRAARAGGAFESRPQ